MKQGEVLEKENHPNFLETPIIDIIRVLVVKHSENSMRILEKLQEIV